MKKLLGGASAIALILGLSAPGLAADLTIGPGSASADAISANVEFQDVTNDVDLEDELADDDALYNGAMLFGDTTFADQDVVVNNYNTGVNGTQQGGIAVAVANPGKARSRSTTSTRLRPTPSRSPMKRVSTTRPPTTAECPSASTPSVARTSW